LPALGFSLWNPRNCSHPPALSSAKVHQERVGRDDTNAADETEEEGDTEREFALLDGENDGALGSSEGVFGREGEMVGAFGVRVEGAFGCC
jgi:hypothetical protein